MEVIQNTSVEYTEIGFFWGGTIHSSWCCLAYLWSNLGLKMHHFGGADPCRMEVRGQGRPERQNKNHQFWVGAATGPWPVSGCSRNVEISITWNFKAFNWNLHFTPKPGGFMIQFWRAHIFWKGGLVFSPPTTDPFNFDCPKIPTRRSAGECFASTLEIHRWSGGNKRPPPRGGGFEEETAADKDSRLMQLGNLGDLTMALRSSKRIHHLTLGMQKSLNNHWDNVPTLLEKYLTSIRLLFLCGSSSSPFFSGWDKLRIH